MPGRLADIKSILLVGFGQDSEYESSLFSNISQNKLKSLNNSYNWEPQLLTDNLIKLGSLYTKFNSFSTSELFISAHFPNIGT